MYTMFFSTFRFVGFDIYFWGHISPEQPVPEKIMNRMPFPEIRTTKIFFEEKNHDCYLRQKLLSVLNSKNVTTDFGDGE